MAKHRRRRASRQKKHDDYPGWVWMLFGLAIGLSVAFAVYIKDRTPVLVVAKPEPQSALDENSEVAAAQPKIEEPAARRFDFYTMLPNFEVQVAEEKPQIEADAAPRAIEEPGVYVLQAGSFSTHNDADRRRAQLALHGIESHIQRVKVNDRSYHRVYIGPTDDLDELNILRSRLRAARIDVLRIRLSD